MTIIVLNSFIKSEKNSLNLLMTWIKNRCLIYSVVLLRKLDFFKIDVYYLP